MCVLSGRTRSTTRSTLGRCDMSNIRAIRTEADYQTALARINELMDAEFGTPDGDELDVLTDLVELYEARHVYRRPSTGRTTRPGRTRTWIPMPSRPGAGKCSRVPTRCHSQPPTSPARSISNSS